MLNVFVNISFAFRHFEILFLQWIYEVNHCRRLFLYLFQFLLMIFFIKLISPSEPFQKVKVSSQSSDCLCLTRQEPKHSLLRFAVVKYEDLNENRSNCCHNLQIINYIWHKLLHYFNETSAYISDQNYHPYSEIIVFESILRKFKIAGSHIEGIMQHNEPTCRNFSVTVLKVPRVSFLCNIFLSSASGYLIYGQHFICESKASNWSTFIRLYNYCFV